jgi:hypothetical protein
MEGQQHRAAARYRTVAMVAHFHATVAHCHYRHHCPVKDCDQRCHHCHSCRSAMVMVATLAEARCHFRHHYHCQGVVSMEEYSRYLVEIAVPAVRFHCRHHWLAEASASDS